MSYTEHYWLLALIPLLPAAGALVNGIFGSRLPNKVNHWIACSTIGVSFLISLLAFKAIVVNAEVHEGHTIYPELSYTLYQWFAVGSLKIDVSFFLDPLSATMALVVTGVGFLIHVYSIGYMHGDRSYARYFTYLNLFAFAMLVLILAKNMVLLFVGWEGVGLASYLLIGFWYEDDFKASCGKKAFIVNRIGDFAVLLALFMLFAWVGTLDIPSIKDWVFELSAAGGPRYELFLPFATAIGIFLFIGCTGKSAQIPLYVWLPDAMAGPTPVSALIHAATMVTAGVYLVSRMNFIFGLSEVALMVVAVVGVLTAFVAGTIGIAQTDIKKVLAYSTVSQLGYMFVAAGVGAYGAAIFHLMTHAFFKALLFLGSGAVIHALHGEQDINKMGGLAKKLPITHITFLFACIAISGVPLFSGFFSKDEILWSAFASSVGPGYLHTLSWVVAVITAGITGFYMFRLYFLTFWGKYRGEAKVLEHLHKPGLTMVVPLSVLAILSLIGGYVGVPAVLGGGAHFEHWLAPVVGHLGIRFEEHAAHTWEWITMTISVVVAFSGIGLAYVMYMKRTELPGQIRERIAGLHRWVENKYYVDEAYDKAIVRPLWNVSVVIYKVIDRVLIDTLLISGYAMIARFGGMVVRQFQNGNLQRYAFFVLFGLSLTLLLVYTG